MRNLFTSTAVAIALLGGTISTPAFALGSGLEDEAPELNQRCQAQPSVKSGFTALAVNVEEVVISEREEANGSAVIVGDGSPTATYTFANARLNPGKGDGDHTIFATATGSLTYATATKSTPMKRIETRQYEFDCHVHKAINGKGNDARDGAGWNAPPDQQVYGLASETFEVVIYFTKTETITNWSPDGATTTEDLLICNLASRAGASWQMKNGYTGTLGSCATLAAQLGD